MKVRIKEDLSTTNDRFIVVPPMRNMVGRVYHAEKYTLAADAIDVLYDDETSVGFLFDAGDVEVLDDN